MAAANGSFYGTLLLSSHVVGGRGQHGRLLLHFMVCLGSHATTNTTEYNIGYAVDDMCCRIVSLTRCADGDARQEDGKNLKAVVAADQTDVVVVKAEVVPLADHVGRCTHGTTWEETCLKAHAGDGTSILSEVPWLQAATSTEISLSTTVVGPSGSGLDMIQNLVPHVHLNGTETKHGDAAATGGRAGGLTQRDVEIRTVVRVLSQHGTVLSPLFIFGQGFGRETKQAHGDMWFGKWKQRKGKERKAIGCCVVLCCCLVANVWRLFKRRRRCRPCCRSDRCCSSCAGFLCQQSSHETTRIARVPEKDRMRRNKTIDVSCLVALGVI